MKTPPQQRCDPFSCEQSVYISIEHNIPGVVLRYEPMRPSVIQRISTSMRLANCNATSRWMCHADKKIIASNY
jgi:hypothetical protein